MNVSIAIALPPEALEAIAMRAAELLREQHAAAPPREYLTPIEAADYLRCSSRQRIYDLTSAGRLRACKDGSRSLFKRSDLDAYLSGDTA